MFFRAYLGKFMNNVLNIRMTKYIYPLKGRLIFSNELNVYFDNARTTLELAYVKKYLEGSLYINNKESFYSRFSKSIPSPEDQLIIIKKYFNELINDDDHLLMNNDYFDFLSKIWVIIRFEQSYKYNLNKRIHKTKTNHSFNSHELPYLSETENHVKFISNFDYLVNFLLPEDSSRLIDRCCTMDDIYDEYYLESVSYKDTTGYLVHLLFSLENYSRNKIAYQPFNQFYDEFIKIAERIDNIIKNDKYYSYLFIGEYIKQIGSERDQKLNIVTLSSIIEFLLIKKKNNDSIANQFRLKTAWVLHYDDHCRVIENLIQELGFIYDLRSNIVHGNFKELIEVFKNKDIKFLAEHLEEYLENITKEMLSYVKIILQVSLSNPKFIETLKNN